MKFNRDLTLQQAIAAELTRATGTAVSPNQIAKWTAKNLNGVYAVTYTQRDGKRRCRFVSKRRVMGHLKAVNWIPAFMQLSQ